MGVYIKGMEMPKSCLECDWCAHTIPDDNYICYRLNRAVIGVAKEDVNETVNACCPIVPVPAHGDLIDRDAMMQQIEHDTPLSTVFEKTMRRYLHNAPTIIPAEEGET